LLAGRRIWRGDRWRLSGALAPVVVKWRRTPSTDGMTGEYSELPGNDTAAPELSRWRGDHYEMAFLLRARIGSQMTKAVTAMANGMCTAVRVSLLSSRISPPM
jgi:hypothetical protein